MRKPHRYLALTIALALTALVGCAPHGQTNARPFGDKTNFAMPHGRTNG